MVEFLTLIEWFVEGLKALAFISLGGMIVCFLASIGWLDFCKKRED